MGVTRQHRLDAVSCYVSQIGVIDAAGVEIADVRVTALMWSDV